MTRKSILASSTHVQLIYRARIAYAKAGGREQPSSASDVCDANGATLITLKGAGGTLATYRADGDFLKRITDLSRYQMPFEDRREFVSAMFRALEERGQDGISASMAATQKKLMAAAVSGGFKEARWLAESIKRNSWTATTVDLIHDAIDCAGGVDACWDTIEVETMFAAAFNSTRDPRSDEYKAGVRAALRYRIDGSPIVRPYPVGSAADDAFDGGQAEGHFIWRRTQAASAEFEATGRLPDPRPYQYPPHTLSSHTQPGESA